MLSAALQAEFGERIDRAAFKVSRHWWIALSGLHHHTQRSLGVGLRHRYFTDYWSSAFG
jgi:hypothetical protein